MQLERLENLNHPMYDKAMELYKISFPVHEQRENYSQKEILKDKNYHFDLIYDEKVFVGLILYWETEDYIYVEHFCILPEARNRRYGARALELLKEKGKVVILEIDLPIDEQSTRRKGFYERCEFAENSYVHIHSPYHRGNQGHELILMTFPKEISKGMYESFREYLEYRIMENAFV